MKAIQVKECGGAEKMQYVDIATPEPGPQQARIKVAAAGVNFIDVYFRTGLYKADNALILQGAIPTALLALLVQGLFELAERSLVPEGLRLRRQV